MKFDDIKLMISLSISGVDGSTESTLTSTNAMRAKAFLQENDHEGASVSMNISVHDQDVYRILEFLVQ